MAALDEYDLRYVVSRVVERIKNDQAVTKVTPSAFLSSGSTGLFDSPDSAVQAALSAQEQLTRKSSLQDRQRLIEAMRMCARQEAQTVSEMAVRETGLGRVEDKVKKNLLAANKTPGTEILVASCITGDYGLALVERAPFGVVAAVTPCTNPTETILCNAIGLIAGGNTVVFNVHPSAKKVCSYFVTRLNDAIVSTGGPANLLSMIADPTIESANALMTHQRVRLVVVTGGPGVVQAAMKSGKRAICGGPGNPPVVVDETADIRKAGEGIVRGASFDNNIICSDEKEVFCVADVADRLKKEMTRHGAVELAGHEIKRLEKLVMDAGHTNKDWVGKDASVIAQAMGKSIEADARLLLCEVDSEDHPFVTTELLMPILPLVRVGDVDTAIAKAKKAEKGNRHTAGMYSTNIDALHKMAVEMDCSIFVKNAPHYAGLGYEGEGHASFTIASPTGEGLTTALSFTRERRCTLKDHFRIV